MHWGCVYDLCLYGCVCLWLGGGSDYRRHRGTDRDDDEDDDEDEHRDDLDQLDILPEAGVSQFVRGLLEPVSLSGQKDETIKTCQQDFFYFF